MKRKRVHGPVPRHIVQHEKISTRSIETSGDVWKPVDLPKVIDGVRVLGILWLRIKERTSRHKCLFNHAQWQLSVS